MVTRVMILAGGTGGHVFPALAVAQNLREKGAQVFWMGTKRGLESSVVPNAGLHVDWLKVSGLRGKGWMHRITAPFMLAIACIQAAMILFRRKPCVVLGMGGFVSGPGGLMSILMRIPLVIHEQNRVPGTTNRLLAKFAQIVLEAFPESFEDHISASFTGNPLRKEICAQRPIEKNTSSIAHLLVIGGSQGARILNRVVPNAMALIEQPVEIIHQCGKLELAQTQQTYLALGVEAQVKSFIEDMAAMYRWADIVVCRSGAMTVSELAACGKPSILVPFPHAIDDHQMRNAEYLANAGAAVLMPQTQLDPARLAKEIIRLIADRSNLESMARAAKMLAKPDAADRVADICLKASK